MLKTVLKYALVLLIFPLKAQVSTDTLVSVSGKILSAKDSTAVSASLMYEKLPYYDDIGVAQSTTDGSFNLPLIKGNSYNFTIKKDGFVDFSKEIRITGQSDGSLSQDEAFYLEVDEIELIKLENLAFSTGSATISTASYKELDELAVWMNENATVVVQLEGHTDFRGNAQAQVNLSQARVDAVRDYLIKQRVKKSRILTKAFGGTRPISREDTAEARALNRRVEVRVIRR